MKLEEIIEKLKSKGKEDERNFKEYLFELLKSPDIRPTPLKSLEVIMREERSKVDECIKIASDDIQRSVKCYIESVHENEKEQLSRVFQKLFSLLTARVDGHPIELLADDDFEFLKGIAERKFSNKEYQEASCMYRFILELNMSFSEAWVGWALSELAQEHFEIVNLIYPMALELLPNDYYICLYASSYYASIQEVDKAKAILMKALDELRSESKENSIIYKELNKTYKRLFIV